MPKAFKIGDKNRFDSSYSSIVTIKKTSTRKPKESDDSKLFNLHNKIIDFIISGDLFIIMRKYTLRYIADSKLYTLYNTNI